MMIQILFVSPPDAEKFATDTTPIICGMESNHPRALSSKNIFLGTMAISETTSIAIDESSINNNDTSSSKDHLVAGTSRTIVTFENIGPPRAVEVRCQTPEGTGKIVQWIEENITYKVKMDGSGDLKEFTPHDLRFQSGPQRN